MTNVETKVRLPGLLGVLSENWWLFLLRGLAAIAFGVVAVLWPKITVLSLILVYGAFALTDGVFALVAAIAGNTARAPRWWLALIGLAGIAIGVMTFVWPIITALVLLAFIAAWAIATGVLQIIGAIQLRKEIDNEWMLILSGVLSVLFGLALIVAPGAGALALIWVIAFYAILFGVMQCAFAFRLRRLKS
ncbi:MAG TPA: HdeD family acid-resistance protein [Xanthobacteraceae bacterium]|nr:HdeD family acid-resistance protein [Xanthobacteraceae bacterium]